MEINQKLAKINEKLICKNNQIILDYDKPILVFEIKNNNIEAITKNIFPSTIMRQIRQIINEYKEIK